MWPWRRKKQHQTSFVSPILSALEVQSVRDTAGFERGVILDNARHQATVISRAESSQPLSVDALHELEQALSAEPDLLSVATVAEVGETRHEMWLCLAFAAVEAREKKDHSELLTTLAVTVDGSSQIAEDHGIALWPLNAGEVTDYATAVWGESDTPSWPPQAEAGEVGIKNMCCGEQSSITFELNLDNNRALEDEVLAILGNITDGPLIRYARIFRPAAHAADGDGRRSLFITITDETDEAVEAQAQEFIMSLSSQARLRVRRFIGRQETGFLAAAGLIQAWDYLALEAVS